MSQPSWITASDLGGAIATSAYSLTLLAVPTAPATSVSYTLISGALPTGWTLSAGTISGTVPSVDVNTAYVWTVRATDNLGNFRDRGFTLTATPQPAPYFTDVYTLVTELDSTWIERQVLYYNTDPAEPVVISLEGGQLPTGLELTATGIIRGYAVPPTLGITVSAYSHFVDSISSTVLRTATTASLQPGAQIVYASSSGNIVAGTYYYVREVLNSTDYTISLWQSGTAFTVGTVVGIIGDQQAGTPSTPIRRSSPIQLKLSSDLGIDLADYEIQITNQTLPVAQGGPGLPANSRPPIIANSQTITPTPDASWVPYLLPPPRTPATTVDIGVLQANVPLAWRALGYDFDGDGLTYTFTGLPAGLTGDPTTGWITGTVISATPSLVQYPFTVAVYKTASPAIVSATYNFAMNISNGVVNDISWSGPSDLGTLVNCQISELSVAQASSSNNIAYRLATGSTLPANLSLTSTGLIVGRVADQPTTAYLGVGDTTNYSFTVEAYDPANPLVVSSKTFTVSVLQAFSEPNETLYFRALCDLPTRQRVSNMLNDPTLIPPSAIYRPDDPNFGVSRNIIVQHAFGILSSSIDEYITALQENHYLRRITLGQIETARATDAAGNVVYEVVYSRVVDDLVNNQGVSIPQTITWPRMIQYGANWFTAMTGTFTSYVQILQQMYYAALAPMTTNTLHPASLPDMRQRVIDVLGSVPTFRLLPRWMTSPQITGGAPGYVAAWTICYTKPGQSAAIARNLRTVWDYVLHDVDFQLDRVFVDRSSSFNLQPNLAEKTWLTLPSGSPVPNPRDQHDYQVYFPYKTILPQ